jgi:hypothetical protein
VTKWKLGITPSPSAPSAIHLDHSAEVSRAVTRPAALQNRT